MNFVLCTKNYDYWVLGWVHVADDLEYVDLSHL